MKTQHNYTLASWTKEQEKHACSRPLCV